MGVVLVLAPLGLALRFVATSDFAQTTGLSERVAAVTQYGVGPTVTMGSSIANDAVNAMSLQQQLPTWAGPVSPLTIKGTGPGHWLGMVAQEIEGRPVSRLLLVTRYNELNKSALDTPGRRADFFSLAVSRDPLVVEQVLGMSATEVAIQRFLDSRSTLRDAALDGLSTYTAASFATEGEQLIPSRTERGAFVRKRMERELFPLRRESGPAGVLKGAPGSGTPPDPSAPDESADDSLTGWDVLGDLHARLLANNTRLVLVIPPQSPSVPAPCAGTRYDAKLQELATGLGFDVLDFTFLSMERSHFTDRTHMSASGQARFTPILAEQLVRTGAIGKSADAPGNVATWPCSGS